MIFNPQVGQKVRCVNATLDRGYWFGKVGTIICINGYSFYPLYVSIAGVRHIRLLHSEVEPYILTDEEQDQERRKQHADRYL